MADSSLRIAEVRDPRDHSQFTRRAFRDLRRGDVFRLLEPDGVTRVNAGRLEQALSDTYTDGNVLKIDCEPWVRR